MEALLFMLDSAVMIVMVFMGLRDDRRAPGVPGTSLFRTRDAAAPGPAALPDEDRAPANWAPWEQPPGSLRP